MTTPSLPPLLRAAAELEGLAQWIDSEIAAGQPTKWIARTAATAVRYIAAGLKGER